MPGRIGRVLRVAGNLLTVITVFLFLGFVVTSLFLGWEVNPVLTNGMSPAFEVGDIAVTESVRPEAVEIGDVMVYRCPLDNQLTAHRVTGVRETESGISFETKGDNSEEVDPYLVSADAVTGRAKLHIPFLGHMTCFVRSPAGFSLMLGLPGALVAATEINRLAFGLIPGHIRRQKANWPTGLKKTDWVR